MIGKTVSHYKIIDKLGEGGMGVVYRAEDMTLGRTVALKFLPPELTRDPEAKERFIQEARAASALDHPNICTIHEVGETDDGRTFIAMAYYEGEDLKRRVGRGPLRLDDALDIAGQIAQGLAKAHHRGIVHRDIKPANIIITKDGLVKIVDFGLAKLAGMKLTRTGSTLGTAQYMSPEQARGEEVDARSDIFSLGAVLYEMLTGKHAFPSEYEQATLYAIINEEPEPVTALRSGIPMELERIVTKTLAKKPSERYQHADDLIVDLKRVARESGTAAARATVRPTAGRSRGPRVWIGLAAVIVVVVVAFILARPYLFKPTEKPITSLAVLPFRNMSADPGEEYFSDGMTEAIIKELSQIKALRVISRTSVMRYRNTEKLVPEIARELGVDAIVEGSVLRADHDVRITAQLIAAHPEKHLWADDFTRSLENVLLLQSEVAQAIAREIRVAVTPQERERLAASRPVDPEAHEAYLKGNYFWSKPMSTDAWFKSIEYFQQAIDRDPTFAPAYAGMAKAYDNMASMNVQRPRDAFPKVRAYAEKALALDPSLAEGMLLIADVKFAYDWDFDGAGKYFRKAIELDPNLALGHFWYGFYLSTRGRLSEGLDEMKRGLRLDPISPFTFYIAWFHAIAGEYDSTSVYLRTIEEIQDDPVLMSSALCSICLFEGRYVEAINDCEKAVTGKTPYSLDNLAMAYALSGQTDEARKVLAELLESIGDGYYSPISIASVYCALGDREKAVEYLEKGFRERDIFLVLPIMVPPCIKSYPEYHEIMEKVGIEQ